MNKKVTDWENLAKAEQWSGKEIERLLFCPDSIDAEIIIKLQQEKKTFKNLIKQSNFKIRNALIHTEGAIDGSIDKIKFLKWYKKNGYPVSPELEMIFNGDNHVEAEPWLRKLQTDFHYYIQNK